MAEDRWVGLFAITRLIATGLAVLLLAVHTVTDHDLVLIVLAVTYGAGSTLALSRSPALRRAPAAWAVDAAVALGLIVASGQWRSPFYVFALTALVLPATSLRFRSAVAAAAAFTAGYATAAVIAGVDLDVLSSGLGLESLATHLMMPALVALALAYAAALLRERDRAGRLALEAERRRIGWELHDSAKQRLHAAHLVLSSLDGRVGDGMVRESLSQAVRELRGAATDMETSVSELSVPLLERSLEEALRARADELQAAAGVPIHVEGHAGALPALLETQAFRVASEAITNALRHAGARRIDVRLASRGGRLELSVIDDGRGMPKRSRPASHGLISMAARAESLGGGLEMGAGPDGTGTEVRLVVPLQDGGPR